MKAIFEVDFRREMIIIIKLVIGDILDAPENIICQQVNCMGVMGAGLAKQVRSKYPSVYTYYNDLCKKNTPEKQLGSVLFMEVGEKIIANIFGQVKYGRIGKFTDYEALRKGFLAVLYEATEVYENYTVAIPFNIGCGLAGGDWNIVYQMIEDIFKDYDVTIYKLD